MNRNQAKIEEIIRQEEELRGRAAAGADPDWAGKGGGRMLCGKYQPEPPPAVPFSPDGVTPDNDNWARRKENTVYHFFRSSYRVTLELEDSGPARTAPKGLVPLESHSPPAGGGWCAVPVGACASAPPKGRRDGRAAAGKIVGVCINSSLFFSLYSF